MRDAFDREQKERLLRALLLARDEEEMDRLLSDVCTIRELQDMTQRLEVARLLRQGLVYNEVGRLSGASSATISRVNRCLQHGAGGYPLVLERLEEAEKKE